MDTDRVWVIPELALVRLRAAHVAFARFGTPELNLARRFRDYYESHFPASDPRVNQSLCELLVYLGSSHVVHRTLPRLESAATQEEKLNYLFLLRVATNGWSLADRQTYFAWLGRARREFRGANALPTTLNYLRADAEATLTPAERVALKDALAALDHPPAPPPPPATNRPFVREWTMAELTSTLAVEAFAAGRRDLARGGRLFTETGCAQCHRFGAAGGVTGPDLTAVGRRFDRRTILESIIEPSRVVAEVYRTTTITLKDGSILDGRVLAEDAATLTVATNPTDPDRRRRLKRTEVASQRISEVSPMPAGLANTLTKEEMLDLLAWLESGKP